VLFLSWATLTYVWAEDGNAVLTAVFRYSLAISLLFVVFTAVQRERDVILVTGAMALGAVCAAVYGFLSPAEAGIGQLERLSGTLGEANELAAALTVGIGLGGGLLAIAKSPPVRVLIAVGIGFCLLALLQTGSRAGLVAILAMLVAAIVLARGRRLSLVIVTLTVLLIAIGYYLMAAPEQSRERITNPGSGTGRVDLWTVGLRMVEANPVEGVGAGNFPVSSIHYLLRPGSLPDDQYIADSPKVAHNIYLEVLAELGIPGAILFLVLLLFGLGCSVAALSRFRQLGERRLQALAMSIAVSLVGLLAADLFASEQYERELWLLLGLGPALLAMAKRMERTPRPTP
jgi:O-antigen ligase